MEYITDEMLTRYLCGTSPEEERRAVEDYLAESDERIDDLINIAEAIKLVDIGPRPGRGRRCMWR